MTTKESPKSLASPNVASFPGRMDAKATCPNCGGRGLSLFYAVNRVPVHSCLLMPNANVALDYPKGDLLLGHCSACGFICNTLFELSNNEYSTRYEETQGFSPTFNKFARELARRWIDRYDLHNKRVLEIGCGKGEFLALLCELGPNSGIGIDPSYVPGRLDSPALSRMEFFQELYSEAHSHLPADFITCRHSLEHIAPVKDFMKIIRATIGERRNTVVAFDLPDVLRVLTEGAFWDIYYEHCSYFSAGSLARLFRAAKLDVTELERDYDDQYLVIGSHPVDTQTPPRLPLENDLAEMAHHVARFPAVVSAQIEKWGKCIRDIATRGKRVVLWGSGSKGVAFLTTLGITNEIEYVVDINPYRQGKFMPGTGHPIVAPQFLVDYRPDYVIIMNAVYTREIGDNLRKLGLSPELLPV
jgi:SAM-dependent methyltransferase